MAVPVYQEQAQRYQNPETGKFMGTEQAEAILNQLNSQTSLLQEIDSNTEETAQEKRDRKVKQGNTDKKGALSGLGTKIGDGLKSVGGFLKDKNPLSTDRNPLTRLLGFGALAGLLKLFGDKLTGEDGALTKLLEWFKLTFIPWAESTWKSISEYDYEAGFKKIGDFFKSMKKFFTDMDTDGDGKVSFDEAKTGIKTALENVALKIANSMKEGIFKLVDEYKKEIAIVFGAYVVSKVVMARLMYGAVGAAGLTKLGLAAVVIAGFGLLIGKVKTAYNAAITDELGNEQEFDMSKWVAYMLAGPDNKGGKDIGWFDAFTSSWKDALAGAAVGAGIGALAGGGLFSVPGILIGAFSGALLGMMGKKVGSDKIDEEIDKAGVVFEQLQDDMVTVAKQVQNKGKALIDVIAAVFDPDVDTKDAYLQATSGDGQQNFDEADRQIRSKKNQIKNLLIDVELNKTFASSPAHEKRLNAGNYALLNKLSDEIKALNIEKANAFETADDVNNTAALNEFVSLNQSIDAKKKSIADIMNAPGYSGGTDSEFMSGQLAELKVLENRRDSLQSERMLRGQSMSNIGPQFDFKDLLVDKKPKEKFEGLFKGTEVHNQLKLEAQKYNSLGGPPSVISAPTTVTNQGDKIISSLNAVPAYSAANMLTQTWISAIGNPHATFNR
jgi:hypothetical protein